MRRQKTAITVISKIGERTAAGNACLIVIYGEELGRTYQLDRNVTTMGRSTKCEIHIDQEAVSRNHAKIVNAFGDLVLSDMGSTNGTYVNDELVDQRVLKNGDYLKVGRTILKFLSGNNIESAYHEEIYRLTTIDGLTGLFNRRYLLEQLEREIFRARRYKRDLALMLFEVDKFADVNSAFGHLAGDTLLAQLAKMLKVSSRREDVVCRVEREQFGAALPEIELRGAKLYADRLLKTVSDHTFEFDGTPIKVTVSAGIAVNDAEGDVDKLVNAARDHLIMAKSRGGNCVGF